MALAMPIIIPTSQQVSQVAKSLLSRPSRHDSSLIVHVLSKHNAISHRDLMFDVVLLCTPPNLVWEVSGGVPQQESPVAPVARPTPV